MKNKTLLITTMLCTSMLLGVTACSHKAASMTGSNSTATSHTDETQDVNDAHAAAEDFVGQINYARIALAKHKADRAELHIVEARRLMEQLKDTTVEERSVSHIESGRVVYKYDTQYQYHYFPIITGPMEIKKMSHGPIWAKDDLAVTDADIVYLTIDLDGEKAAKRLDEAETDVKAGNLKAADAALAKLTNEVVTVDEKTADPLEKARDNIALARNFVSSGNYAGARFALKHADNALDAMQKDDTYEEHRTDIIKMRREVSHLQTAIMKKDPTLAHKASVKLDQWWSDLKDWSEHK